MSLFFNIRLSKIYNDFVLKIIFYIKRPWILSTNNRYITRINHFGIIIGERIVYLSPQHLYILRFNWFIVLAENNSLVIALKIPNVISKDLQKSKIISFSFAGSFLSTLVIKLILKIFFIHAKIDYGYILTIFVFINL